MEINAKRRQIDMLNGPLWSRLPMFALPVAATAILEQLFNASDIAVVGNFTGAERTAAVAAVGAHSKAKSRAFQGDISADKAKPAEKHHRGR